MLSDKYEILIHDTFGEDLSYIDDLERPDSLPYPTVSDTMRSVGPVLAHHYQAQVQTSVLNVVDTKHYRVIEFVIDAKRAALVVLKKLQNSLQWKS